MSTPTAALCSFCGRANEAFDMIWSPNGRSICCGCVNTFRSDASMEGFADDITVLETECVDIEHMRADWRGATAGGSPWTHAAQRLDGRRVAAYKRSDASLRLLIEARLPVLPATFDEGHE